MKITEEENRKKLIERMGEELGMIYFTLEKDALILTLKWLNFKELYGSEANIQLLNRVAPEFFFLTQNVFWQNMILSVGKLLDNATTGKGKNEKKNITLETLIESIVDPTLNLELEIMLKSIRQKGSFCKDWRNRYIAHSDFDLRLKKEGFEPLKPSSEAQLVNILEEVYAFLNKVLGHYFNGRTLSYFDIVGISGAKRLISYLATHNNEE